MSTPGTPGAPVLEAAARAFAEATANPPYLFDLPVDEGRKTVDTAQGGEFLRSLLWDEEGALA